MFQKVTIIGNLGADPELRYLPDGTAVCNLSVATNRRWNDANGQRQEETTWFRVSVWGRRAEVANQYLTKGRQLLIEGTLRPDPATGGPRVFTRQDGSAGAAYELRADSFTFLGGAGDDGGNGNGGSYQAPQPAAQPRATGNRVPETEEIPF